MNLRAHYNQLWEDTLKHYQAGAFEPDPQLDNPQDMRFGLTLLARPDEQVKGRLLQFTEELRQLEPEQYYYPASDLHITVLSIISCYSGFTPEQVEVAQYTSLLREIIQHYHPFNISFTGITASPATVIAQGFTDNDTLDSLREQLRVKFRASGLQQSIDQRYAIRTAHSTLVRYRAPLQRQQAFISKLQQYREVAFGTSNVAQLELVYNDWYQRKERVQVLSRFELS